MLRSRTLSTLGLTTALALTMACLTACSGGDNGNGNGEGNGNETPSTAPADAGASAAPVEGVVLHLAITGMSCTGCEDAITQTVARIDGVLDCKVDHTTGSAVVTVDDASRAEAVVKAVNDMPSSSAQLVES
jgi:copper chaperone